MKLITLLRRAHSVPILNIKHYGFPTNLFQNHLYQKRFATVTPRPKRPKKSSAETMDPKTKKILKGLSIAGAGTGILLIVYSGIYSSFVVIYHDLFKY